MTSRKIKIPLDKSYTHIDKKNHPFLFDFIEKSYMTRHKYYFISKCVIFGCLLYFVTWHLISIIKFVFYPFMYIVYTHYRKELTWWYINIEAWHIFVLFNMFIIFFYCLVESSDYWIYFMHSNKTLTMSILPGVSYYQVHLQSL